MNTDKLNELAELAYPRDRYEKENQIYFEGLEAGCESQLPEIQRLNGLIEKAHEAGYCDNEKYSLSLSWLGFKTDNNL